MFYSEKLSFEVYLDFFNFFFIKVEYHANENPSKHSKKIAYVGQRLMYPIIKKI